VIDDDADDDDDDDDDDDGDGDGDGDGDDDGGDDDILVGCWDGFLLALPLDGGSGRIFSRRVPWVPVEWTHPFLKKIILNGLVYLQEILPLKDLKLAIWGYNYNFQTQPYTLS